MKKLVIITITISIIGCLTGFSRESIDFCDDWLFCKGDTIANLEEVTLPHCWNAQDGTTKDYYRGTGTYVKTFDLDCNKKNSKVFLRFEAASLKAEAWLNGHYLGNHKGAFNAFIFDITEYLKKKDNELIVKVDNSADDDIIPLDGDFTIFGGIYRPASLIITPVDCITPMDYASTGVYITPLTISPTKVTAAIDVLIDTKPGKYAMRTSVLDSDGRTIASSLSENIVKKHGFQAFTDTINITNPILWDGINSAANLYSFRFELLKKGKMIDALEVEYGFRDIKIGVSDGLKLNGRPYKIRGVNRHQDRPGKGWAISQNDHKEDMSLIKEIGANGIRLAHYPHSNYFYDLCDKEGMLAWAEIPFIGRGTLESKNFNDNLETQLIELIRQNYNHTSIFCWSLFNELGGEKDYGPIIQRLDSIAHAEDPARYTTAAPNNEGRPENFITDLIAYNVYPGWYWAGPEAMSYAIDWKYKPSNRQPLAISEYGAGASINHHGLLSSAPETTGDFHPEEWQAQCHEINYREIDKRDMLWGSFIWNMFDFASAGRNEGEHAGMNDKGLVTYDRKNRKDAFWFYKANWNNSEPVVHIASKRWTPRQMIEVKDIKVYSNCPDLTVKVNGTSVPVIKEELNTFIISSFKLNKGENTIEAIGSLNGEKTTDRYTLTIE